MWWHYRPAPFHFEQYMRELLVQVKKGPTWSCQTSTEIQKMDLWLEAIASMPITFIWKHVDVDKMKKYAAQCFALCIEKNGAVATFKHDGTTHTASFQKNRF